MRLGLEVEVWSFSGCWCLELGILFLRRHRRQRDRAKQSAIGERPVGGVEGFVIQVHNVDVAEGFPRHAALVQVADAVGGDAGGFHFERIAGGFQVVHEHAE